MPVLELAAARAQQPVAGDFQKVTLDDNTQNPMELDIAPDGRVFYIERDGRLMIWKPDTRQTVTAGKVPVTRQPGERPARAAARARLRVQQVGLPLLLAAAGQHAHAGRLALQGQSATRSTCPPSRRSSPSTTRRRSAATPRGSLYFGPDGSLYISTGDNTNPFDSDGYNPIDEQTGRECLGRAAHVGQHERPQRQDPAHQADGDPDSARPASARPTRSRPATSSTRPPTPTTRPGRRSSAWASATRSASPSTRPRAGC